MKRILIFFFLLFCTFISQLVEAKDYMLVCGKQDGVAKVWYLDLETSLSTGVSVVVGETELKDESGNVITATPLGITTDGGKFFWVSFDDRKIRKYNITGEPEKVDATNWYWQTSSSPDGLYYAGTTLYYCSTITDAIFSINLSTGVETRQKVTVNGTDFDVISRRLAIDGVATDNTGVNYTTRRYSQDAGSLFAPTAISQNFLCSASLNKIVKKEVTIGYNFVNTLPSQSPIWTNEQTTPAPTIGIVEVTDYSILEGYVVYLSSNDGNIYKVRLKNKTTDGVVPSQWTIAKQWSVPDYYGYGIRYSQTGAVHGPGVSKAYTGTYATGPLFSTSVYRSFGTISPPAFINARIVRHGYFLTYYSEWDGGPYYVLKGNNYSILNSNISICSYNRQGTLEEQFNSPLLVSLWAQLYDGTPPNYGALLQFFPSTTLNVTDVTGIIPTTPFYYTGRYSNEDQDFSLTPPVTISAYTGHVGGAIGDVISREISNALYSYSVWTFLTDNGSLEVLDQFTTPVPSPQDITATKNLSIAKDIYPDPIPFYPSLEGDPASKTKIRYKTIVKPEKVGFEVRNLITSSLIYKIDLLGTEPVNPGKLFDEYEYEWDGKDTAGQIVSKGLYSINVKLKDSQNNLLYDSATSPQLYAYAYSPTINTSARTATFNYQVWAWGGSPAPETAKVYMNLYDDDEFRLIKRLLVAEENPINQQQSVTWNYSAYGPGKYYYTIWAEDKRGEQAHIRGGSFTVPEHIITGTRGYLVRDRVGWKFEGPIIRVRQPSMVAVGDSITAGMQHFTLVEYLQQDSYVNLLARQMGIDKFDLPLIRRPGAGLPIFQVDAQKRIIPELHLTPGTGIQIKWEKFSPAGSRIQPDIFVHNVAVPGANTAEVLYTQTDYSENRLFELVLQGRFDATGRGTEVDQAVFMRPNLIILWTGNNDVLRAAIFADTDRLTAESVFKEAFREIVRRLKEWTDPDGPTGPLKGADIIVSDIPDVTSIPNLFQVGEQVGDLPFEVFRRRWIVAVSLENITNQVENFVIPRGVNGRRGEQYPEGTFVPWRYLFEYFFWSGVDAGPNEDAFRENEVLTPGVDLNGDGDFRDPGEFLNEIEQIRERTNQFNNIIRDIAQENNIPVVSANDLLRRVDVSFAGGNFSFDGVHPSSRGHRLVANEFIKKLNEVILERGSFGKQNIPIDELTIDP